MNETEIAAFDCLDIRFYFSSLELQDVSLPGYTNKYIGYDLFAPELDISHMLPVDLVSESLDTNITANSLENSGSWSINTEWSYKVCTANVSSDDTFNCKFSAHFVR